MEKERDFYFGKLRNIELICQEKEGEGDPTLQKIVDILYATDVSVYHVFKDSLRLNIHQPIQFCDCFYFFSPIFQQDGFVIPEDEAAEPEEF